MRTPDSMHATALLIGACGILLRGKSGSGKSSLALALLQKPPRSDFIRLVSDDQVVVWARAGRVLMKTPPVIGGRLEVRGLGLFHFPHEELAQLHVVVDLTTPAAYERLPADYALKTTICGIELPRFLLHENDSRNADRVSLLVHALRDGLDLAALSQ